MRAESPRGRGRGRSPRNPARLQAPCNEYPENTFFKSKKNETEGEREGASYLLTWGEPLERGEPEQRSPHPARTWQKTTLLNSKKDRTKGGGRGWASSVLAWFSGKGSRRSGGQDGRGPRTAVKNTGRLLKNPPVKGAERHRSCCWREREGGGG